MGTFVEFYQTLLGFVNFRLYTSVGLVYPPKYDATSDDQGAELGAFTLEGNNISPLESSSLPITNGRSENVHLDPQLQAEIDKLVLQLNEPEKTLEVGKEFEVVDKSGEIATDSIDKFEPAAPGGDVLPQPTYSSTDPSTLFSNLTFFLSRETPRQPLEFILRAFGCKRIGWDAVLGDGAFTHNELDPAITHHIVDRPQLQALPSENLEAIAEDGQAYQRFKPCSRVPGRIYVQPQWVWDSINDEELKAPHDYAPGAQLPPHLSPFVKNVRGQYDPTVPLAEQEREDEDLEAESEPDDKPDISEDEQSDALGNANGRLIHNSNDHNAAEGMEVASSGSESEGDSNDNDIDSFGGFSDAESISDDEATISALQRQRELEAELTGVALNDNEVAPGAKAKAEARKKAAKQRREEDEELERAKMMMSRKKRKILEKMIYSNKKKDAEAEALRAKRRKIEKGQ